MELGQILLPNIDPRQLYPSKLHFWQVYAFRDRNVRSLVPGGLPRRSSRGHVANLYFNGGKVIVYGTAGTSQYGMQTFDPSLFDLYSKELITLDEALMRASIPDEFNLRIQGIRSAADAAREEMACKWPIFERFACK
jgi:hypothetical protein